VAYRDALELAQRIPSGFTMGVATSSWQIEGASSSRGRSIWDEFSETPGRVLDGATADPACDHLARITEDVDLIAGLGVDAYRFLSPGRASCPKALGRFLRQVLTYITGLSMRCPRGASPLLPPSITGTCPRFCKKKGGWLHPDSHKWFADYCYFVAEHFGDRIDTMATLNEPWVSAFWVMPPACTRQG